jgi:hypothetical protein
MTFNERLAGAQPGRDSEVYPMFNNDGNGPKGEVASDEASYFHLDIRVRHDEMAQWSQERLATFFEAVSVLMAAKTQSKIPSRPSASLSGSASIEAQVNAEVEQRLKKIEQSVDGVRRHVNTLHESVAEDFKAFEDNLAQHNNQIQSAKTAMSQTDDLVERVVEALEVLQTSNFTGQEDQAAHVAVN